MRRVVAALLLAGLVGASACKPSGGNGGGNKNVEWQGVAFRNCAVPRTPPPGPAYGVRRGFVHIILIVLADRYNDNGTCIPNISLPIQIRINGKLDGQQAFKLDRGRALPWKASVETMWIEHMYIGPLKPSSAGKFWEASVHASHITDGLLPSRYRRANIRCVIFVDGIRADSESDRLREGIAVASCLTSGVLRGG